MASVKKVVKSKGQPRHGCDGDRSMAKILITTIQVNFELIPDEASINSPELLLLKFSPSTYTSQPFLGCPL